MSEFLLRFASDDSGATAIEYGLIATFVFLMAVGGFMAFGEAAKAMFEDIAAKISTALT